VATDIDSRLADVLDVLRAAHLHFAPATISRLVDRLAANVAYLSGTEMHAVVVHDEAERLLAYVD
jgi:hypothetical protein